MIGWYDSGTFLRLALREMRSKFRHLMSWLNTHVTRTNTPLFTFAYTPVHWRCGLTFFYLLNLTIMLKVLNTN